MNILLHILMILMLLTAAYSDLKWRQIPNFLTVSGIVLALFIHSLFNGWEGFRLSLLGLLIAGGLFFILYAIGSMGAGDVKLMAAVGAFVGSDAVLTPLILTILAGGVLAIVIISKKRVAKFLSGFEPPASVNAGQSQKVLKQHSSQGTIPYGLAIAVGSIMAIILRT